MSTHYKRRKKLIKPALQLKVIGVFLGTASIAVLVQTILMSRALSTVPELSDAEHSVLLTALPRILTTNLVISLAVLVPLILLIGITVTHRIVGPVYRFECYLGELARGEAKGPCRIRKNDELHDLCAAINEVSERVRPQDEADETGSEERRLSA